MRKGLRIAIVLVLSIGLWPSVDGGIAAASSDLTGDTDRVIVNLVDKKGDETVESISVEDLEKFNEGSLTNKSSALYSAQDVEVLQPDFIRSIALEDSTLGKTPSWGTNRVGVNRFKNSFTAITRNVTVAVIDTGVDYTHPFLAGRIVAGYDFVSNDTDPMDVHYHGTHVAGIIAETTPSNVKIMPIRVMNKEGSGYDSDVAKGIRFAVDHGASIINMSFGGEGYSQYLADAIDYALSKNVLVVVAAGNESASTDNYFPASNQKVIVVSATDRADNIASFSNTGAAIDVSAPGVKIVSSVPGGDYKELSGTSMATPYVSGIAAILKLEAPSRSYLAIEMLVKQFVDDRGVPGWDPLYGVGIVNISSAGLEIEPDLGGNRVTYAVNKTNLVMEAGQQEQLAVTETTVKPDGSTVKKDVTTDAVFTSANDTIATVRNGKVTALNAGTTEITIKYGGNTLNKVKVTVTNPATNLGNSGGGGYISPAPAPTPAPTPTPAPAPAPTTVPAPTPTNPTKPDPIQPDPVLPDPVKPDPVKSEPVTPVKFTDVSAGYWAKTHIQKAVQMGIFRGYKDGSFRPNDQLTRAQAAALITRSLGLQTDEAAQFNDTVNLSKETQAEIAAAYKYGIVKGQNGQFKPSENVTRVQMALMIARAYEYKTGETYKPSAIAPLSDIRNYNRETVNAISMLYELKIITGSGGKFMPQDPTTRAHASKIFVNFAGFLK